jgi:hypothetical protein
MNEAMRMMADKMIRFRFIDKFLGAAPLHSGTALLVL